MDTAYNINGNVTPITHTDINQIDSSDLESLSLTELYSTLTTLQKRLSVVQSMGKYDAAKQIQLGVDRIQTYINTRI